MPPQDKAEMVHVDNITAAESKSPSIRNDQLELVDTGGTGGDEIVHNLAYAGEEVGLTWRSILAAGVGQPSELPMKLHPSASTRGMLVGRTGKC